MAKRKTKKKKDDKNVQPERSLDEIVGALLRVPPKKKRKKIK